MAVDSDTETMNTLQVQAPQLPNPQIYFIASLSNGETIVENKGDWCWVDGLKSPWNRLIRYTAEKDITINSLSLGSPLGTTWTLPILSGKPRFRGYTGLQEAEKPIDYEVKRFIARDMDVGISQGTARIKKTVISEFYTIAEAIFKDHILQLWVSEANLNLSYMVYKQLKK